MLFDIKIRKETNSDHDQRELILDQCFGKDRNDRTVYLYRKNLPITELSLISYIKEKPEIVVGTIRFYRVFINKFRKWQISVLYNIIKILFILLFAHSCSTLPGVNKEPKNKKASKSAIKDYTIRDINIDIIEINKLKEYQIENYNNKKVKETINNKFIIHGELDQTQHVTLIEIKHLHTYSDTIQTIIKEVNSSY
jgi:hypothetical protein